MSRKPLSASIAALAAASLLLAGCSGDDSSGGDASASKEPSASGSASEPTGTPDGGSTGELTPENFQQAILDAQRAAGSYRGKATTATGPVTSELEAEVVFEGDKPLAHAKTTANSPQAIETVTAAGVVYLKSDGLGIPADKWLKIDPADPANEGNPLAALAAASDPETAVRAMGDLQSLDVVGEEKVEGVDTTHYRAVAGTENFAEALGLPAEATASLPETIPFDVWLDEDNRPVKYEYEVAAAGTTSKATQTYYDYGADVEVTVPDDADTVPLSDVKLGG